METAADAWAAVRAVTPSEIARLVPDGVPGLAFAPLALQRLLEGLPAVGDGLSRTERHALEAIAGGASTPFEAFGVVQSRRQAPFLGDTWFLRALSHLGQGPGRLAETARGEPLPAAPPLGEHDAFVGERLRLTAAGQSVLAGRADRVVLLGLDRWVGGTQPSPAAVLRSDAPAGVLVLRRRVRARQARLRLGTTRLNLGTNGFPTRDTSPGTLGVVPFFTVPLSARRLAALTLFVAVVLVVGLRHAGARGQPTALRVAPVHVRTASRRPATAQRLLVVDVEGAVHRPGLVRVPAGARVADAVARAGGFGRRAERSAVNLAAPVTDGQQVLVPSAGAAPPAGGGGGASGGTSGPISLSSATAEQLDTLPGIGPVTAQKIVAFREQHGPFHAVAELDAIPGIGPARLAELQGLVTP